jgi:ethanolaminephosphotransferase
MCIKALTLEELRHIKEFKYSASNTSIAYNYVVSPLLNIVVKYLPKRLAPNVLTLLSLVFNIISFLFTVYETGNDFTYELSRFACGVQTIAHFMYILLDNLDGKQARRTGTSSSYGMLLDHGCDVFTNIIVCYNVSHLLMLGNTTFFSYCVFIALIPGFFTTTYEEYVLGYLNLPCINGADEGNVFVFMGSLLGWLFTPSIYATKVACFTVGEWLALLVFVGTVFTIGTTLANIAMKKGVSRMLMSLIDWICFYNCILFPVLMCHLNYNEFYSEHLSLIMLTIALLAARQTIDLQIKICSKQTIEYGIIVMAVNVLLPVCYFIENSTMKLTIIGLSVIALTTEIATLVVVRSIEILNHLDRKLLFIDVNDSK